MTTGVFAPAQVSTALGSDVALLDAWKRPRILVVDDDPSVRSLLYDVLTETGYDIDTAADGAQGLLLFELIRQDLAVLDILMPRMTGWELADRIREIDARIPMVVLTGFGATLEEEAARRGAVLMHKPVKLSELTDIVRRLLGWGEQARYHG
jgi:CheY-like chemotaxis protein